MDHQQNNQAWFVWLSAYILRWPLGPISLSRSSGFEYGMTNKILLFASWNFRSMAQTSSHEIEISRPNEWRVRSDGSLNNMAAIYTPIYQSNFHGQVGVNIYTRQIALFNIWPSAMSNAWSGIRCGHLCSCRDGLDASRELPFVMYVAHGRQMWCRVYRRWME